MFVTNIQINKRAYENVNVCLLNRICFVEFNAVSAAVARSGGSQSLGNRKCTKVNIQVSDIIYPDV